MKILSFNFFNFETNNDPKFPLNGRVWTKFSRAIDLENFIWRVEFMAGKHVARFLSFVKEFDHLPPKNRK